MQKTCAFLWSVVHKISLKKLTGNCQGKTRTRAELLNLKPSEIVMDGSSLSRQCDITESQCSKTLKSTLSVPDRFTVSLHEQATEVDGVQVQVKYSSQPILLL